MRSPTNYAEWCTLFDSIAADIRNDDYIRIVANGSIPWTSGVAERFIQSAGELIRKRVNSAQDKYQMQVKNSRGNMNTVLTALQTLKKEYTYVYQLARSLPIPVEYQGKLAKMVQDQADQTQSSLEQSAAADRSGHLAVTVRNAKVNKLS